MHDHTPSPDSVRADAPAPTSTSAAAQAAVASASAASDRAALLKQRVIQPADPDVAARPCPICREPFRGEYSADDEEWIWANAVLVDGTVRLSPLISVHL